MFASITATLNTEDWIEGFLKGLDVFDKRIVVLSNYDYNGNPIDNNDKTEELAKKYADVYHGDWKNQEDRKNHAIEVSKADWIANIDTDMFFTKEAMVNMMKWVENHKGEVQVWWVRLGQYFKNPFYKTIFRNEDAGWYPMWVHAANGLRYKNPLKCNIDGYGNNKHRIPEDVAIGYHFSYVRTDEAMVEKLKTFSHTKEVSGSWYKEKWLASEEIGLDKINDLSVTTPREWKGIEKSEIPYEIWERLPKWCRKKYPF